MMLSTQNETHGFWGTMGGHASVAWPIAMTQVAQATNEPFESIRAFLDSKQGRHFADSVQDGLASSLAINDAVAQAIVATAAFRRKVHQWWADGFDLLVTPTLATLPIPIGAIRNNPSSPMDPMRVAGDFVAFTTAYNVTGQPAISLPLHWTPDGLPVGVQLVGRYADEATILRLAAQLEAEAPWRHRRPPVS